MVDATVDQFCGEDFSPTAWFNTVFQEQKIDLATLSTLSATLQKLCRETSESIEVDSNQLIARLPATVADVSAMKKGVADGHLRLRTAMGRLEGVDHHEQWVKLSDIDAAKKRVEIGRDALREINHWERRVKELETTIRSGAITNATQQLVNLNKVCETLKILPEHELKQQRLRKLENQLFAHVQQKVFLALEKNNAADIQVSAHFFASVGQPEEMAKIVTAHFHNTAQKLLGARNPFELGTSAALVAQTLNAFFDGLTHVTQEAVGMGMDCVPPVLKALRVLHTRISEGASSSDDSAPQEVETQYVARSSRAMAVYTAYADGFEAVCGVMGMKAWNRLLDSESHLIPHWFICDVIRFGMLPPLKDLSDACQPKVGGSVNDALLRAETSSKKWIHQILSVSSEKIRNSGLGALAFAWLASVDATGAEYWTRWSGLLDAFNATIKERAVRGFDASLLTSSVQLHDMFKYSMAEIESTFTEKALKSVVELRENAGYAWMLAVDAAEYSVDLDVPTDAAIRHAAQAARRSTDQTPFRLLGQTMEAQRKRAHALVTQCCVAPISARLQRYDALTCWLSHTEPTAATSEVTQAGEDLFALVPLLEQISHTVMEEWLPPCVHALCDTLVSKALRISHLTSQGAAQLVQDLDYCHKVATAFVAEAEDLRDMKSCLEKMMGGPSSLTSGEEKFEKTLRAALQPRPSAP